MKIWLFLFAALQNFWSIEAGLFSFRYVVGLNLWQSFLICSAMAVLDFNLFYYLAEKGRRWFLLYFRNRRISTWEDYRDKPWVKRCYRWGRLGLFLTGLIPHLLFFGIAAQKIFNFKNGYWLLLFGTLLKVAICAYGFKIFEQLAGY